MASHRRKQQGPGEPSEAGESLTETDEGGHRSQPSSFDTNGI
jgi:hypothetical protein